MDSGPSLSRETEAQTPGYDRVLAFMREQLLSGQLKAGDRLLPERELAARLGVSRPVIREVLRALAAMGVIEIRHGHGSVVRQPDFSQLGDVFTLVLAQNADVVDDIMEARIAIERQAIRLACQRGTAADLERLQDALEAIRATISDAEGGAAADYAFHAALVEAAHSPTLSSLYAGISNLLKRSHRRRRERISGADMHAYLVEHHASLIAALAAREADTCDRLLTQHFEIGRDIQRQAAIAELATPERTNDPA